LARVAPYLTPQATRSTHASHTGLAAAAAALPPGAAALRCAAVTGDTYPLPVLKAWMSQPGRSYDVDVASTSYDLAPGWYQSD